MMLFEKCYKRYLSEKWDGDSVTLFSIQFDRQLSPIITKWTKNCPWYQQGNTVA
jgi:hypothetical protein